ncbi:MAG TPA: Rieske 2Fe-2S domain-containing protein [Dehalococcoidia bacterium]|jgi:nitrite reductase/ring-hydroxylating ferredoxin subunit|nr:Rieske 2Fe-2S domain-containing protein [Dehalococcoidia bacterium]
MLSTKDNEFLARVGPGTPMGNFFRQYWLPAIRSDELPAPDCPPVRIKLLGEELIGYRTTSGKVGLMQNACPHRGASMFFGRNEEEGLRCVYHGWKFDVTGACVDMPSEPAESNFRTKVHATAYKTHERGGIIWAYMGPREVPPPLPDIEANMLAQGPEHVSVLHRACNWMQGLEGEMDTVHAAFLHYGSARLEDQEPGTFDFFHYRERAARFVTVETDFGTANGAYRPAEEDSYYWRVTQILFPFYHMIPGGRIGEGIRIGAYVPMDDYNHLQWEIGTFKPNGEALGRSVARGNPGMDAPIGSRRLPNGTGWHERFRSDQNMDNDFLIDREAQRNHESYTGIAGIRIQDCAVTESMGRINDRTTEHLGTTDSFIIRTRRRLIAMAKALAEQGITPIGVDTPAVYRQRSGEMVIPRSQDWWNAYEQKREAWQPVEVPTTVVSR